MCIGSPKATFSLVYQDVDADADRFIDHRQALHFWKLLGPHQKPSNRTCISDDICNELVKRAWTLLWWDAKLWLCQNGDLYSQAGFLFVPFGESNINSWFVCYIDMYWENHFHWHVCLPDSNIYIYLICLFWSNKKTWKLHSCPRCYRDFLERCRPWQGAQNLESGTNQPGLGIWDGILVDDLEQQPSLGRATDNPDSSTSGFT